MHRSPLVCRVLLRLLRRYASRREPDFVIGDQYLLRWHLLPRNPVCNVYLHLICSDDDDRALHDHPWANCSILLQGSYIEHGKGGALALRREGSVVFRRPTTAHRLELIDQAVWSLFLTGPRVREWGFLCPHGWRHWREFTAPAHPGRIGRGCE